MVSNRILVLGLDAATPELIEPWAEEGYLPHFRQLMRLGMWGRLRSTVPPSSAPAWSSLATGKNPGKHGIFTFVLRKSDGYTIQSVSGGHRKATPLWRILDRQGFRVGVVNMPMTYPPNRLEHGFMISGFDAPGLESDFVYPPHLKPVLRRNQYVIDPVEKDPAASAEMLLHSFQIQKRAFWELKETQPWDVLILVFMQLDRAQHQFWLDMNRADSQFGDVILQLYQEADAILGEILHSLDDETMLIVMSDHGAGPLYSGVSINQWLTREGYLALKEVSKPRTLLNRLLLQAAKLEKLYLPSHARDLFRRRFARFRDEGKSYLLTERIDWSKTTAFSLGTYEGIFINLAGRESQGIVPPESYDRLRSEIADRILSLCDPGTGEPVVQRVFRREELYHGRYADQAPDLMLDWTPGYYRYERVGTVHQYAHEDIFAPKRSPFTNHIVAGSHRQYGILLLHGEPFQVGPIHNAEIVDIAPTILHLLGIAVPKDMDGRVLTEALAPQWLADHPVSRTEPGAFSGPDRTGVYDEDEETVVREHLRALGYLD
jgi:predicted AlkP superfamily phosphohydrolase/phosphomutase